MLLFLLSFFKLLFVVVLFVMVLLVVTFSFAFRTIGSSCRPLASYWSNCLIRCQLKAWFSRVSRDVTGLLGAHLCVPA